MHTQAIVCGSVCAGARRECGHAWFMEPVCVCGGECGRLQVRGVMWRSACVRVCVWWSQLEEARVRAIVAVGLCSGPVQWACAAAQSAKKPGSSFELIPQL